MAIRDSGTASCSYRVGAVVRHRKYLYRGLVLGRRRYPKPGRCHCERATGVDPRGPWYQVLLEGSGLCLCVPGDQLELDRSDRALVNPLAN